MEDQARIKHLEIIQAVISRLASNSFLLRGWGATLIFALIALEAKANLGKVVVIALMVTAAFWLLDAYYLWQERRFRALYDVVRNQTGATDFSMELPRAGAPAYFGALMGLTVFWFWAVLVIAVAVASLT